VICIFLHVQRAISANFVEFDLSIVNISLGRYDYSSWSIVKNTMHVWDPDNPLLKMLPKKVKIPPPAHWDRRGI
jgi:hypothetical protein